MNDDKRLVLTYEELERSRIWLQGELECSMDQGLQQTRDRLVNALEAIGVLFELRRGMNMEPEGATVNEVLAEVRKVYDRDQKMLSAMHIIRDTAVTVLQRR